MSQAARAKFELAQRYFTSIGYPDAYLIYFALYFAESGDYEAATKALTAFQAERTFYGIEVDILNDLMTELVQPYQPPPYEEEFIEELVEEVNT